MIGKGYWKKKSELNRLKRSWERNLRVNSDYLEILEYM